MGAVELINGLRAAGLTVAAAESLTGGLVCGSLTSVAGSSAVVRGGVCTYATDTKASLLGVGEDLLGAGGPVQPAVALAMARGVRRMFGAQVGLATTGVAGPDPQGDAPVGRVFIAVVTPDAEEVEQLALSGDRAAIRSASVERVLALALRNIPTPQHG